MTVKKKYIYVGEIPNYMTEKQVKELFADIGKVLDIKINKGESYALVEHASEEEARKGLEAVNNKEFPDKPPKKWKFYWGSE